MPGEFFLADDGSLFYRPGQGGGDRELALLDASGKFEPWIPERRPLDGPPELSPDGRRIAFTMANARGIDELWVSDIDHPGPRRLGTDPNADCTAPAWSPDGRRIAYARHGKDDKDGIYVQDADGGEAKRILIPESDEIRDLPTSWLPDGSALLITRFAPGMGKIAMLPVTGGEVNSSGLRPLLPSTSVKFLPRLSPDGRLVAFVSNESGKAQSYVAEFRNDGSIGRPVDVKTSGSAVHQWSGDGKTLYLEDERRRLMKVVVSAGPTVSVSTPVQLQDLDKLRVQFWSVLPDGRVFAGMRNENEDEITRYSLVLNWAEELKRKMRD